MNRYIGKLAVLMILLHAGTAHARNIIGTPLPAYTAYMGGFMHYPLDRAEEVCNCFGWEIDIWGQGYTRSAIDAYGPSAHTDTSCTTSCRPIVDPCVTNGSRVELSRLIFGADEFTLAQTFAGSSVGTIIAENPWVTVSTLSPRFTYDEKGVFFGAILGKRFGCDDQWRVGVRFMIPYRDIEVEDNCSDLVGDTIDDVFQLRQEVIGDEDPQENQVWVARLDFLSALNRVAIDQFGNPIPLVNYADPDSAGQLTIGGQAAPDGRTQAQAPTDTSPFIAAIRTADGSVPASVRWGDYPINGATVIQASGGGLINLQRGRFASDINYTPLGADTAAQRQLWIAPNIDATTNEVIGASQTVLDEISSSISAIDPSVTDFLISNSISFCQGGRVKGIGDLDMEWYLGRDHCGFCGNWWAELQLGVRFPTAKKIQQNQVLQLIRQPLGNNGHFEIRPGLVLGFDPSDWCKIKLDVTYSFVLKHREFLPASFTGATIRNLGPATPACVSWGYFVGDIDVTFVNPCCPCLGWMIAYEAYAKQRDKVCFLGRQAQDFIGNLQNLDSAILVAETNRVAHKIRTEVFFQGECVNVYGGFAQVVAGHNVSRDTDMYLGLFASF